MSHPSSPALSNSGYPLPGVTTSSPSPAPYVTGTPSTSAKPKSKPVNVFTNDGSFLERFQRSKKQEGEERRKQDEIINRNMNFETRFKNRGKRPRPEAEESTNPTIPNGTDSAATSPVSSTAGDDKVALTNNPTKKVKLETQAASISTSTDLSTH
ncbi:hypothetical protein AX15_005877 [Amanita polypyramis BW_CC]|nr:hypothetical protein AX15_005877 [Amanita polypyramis BW_CC]